MAPTREQLDAMVISLERCAWQRARANADDPLLELCIHAEASAIVLAADGDDRSYVRERVQRMLLGLHLRQRASRANPSKVAG